MAGNLILIVEDDAIIASMLHGMLLDAGYRESVVVPSGEAAIEAVATHSPTLVLMDIKLAGQIDGVAAAQRIHEVCDVPIVYLTAYAEDQLLERAKASAPYGYLVKPVSERELKATVEMALYRSGLDRKLAESERALREAHELSTALLELGGRSGEAIVMLQDDDHREGLCIYANESFSRISGFSAGELQEVSLFELIHPRDRAVALRDHQRRMKGEDLSGYTEMTLMNRGGQEVLIECTFARSYFRGVPSDVGYLREISTRRMAEEQRLVDDRFLALGNLTAGICRALDGHLSAVSECCEALAAATDLPCEIEELVHVALPHAKHCSAFVQILREYVDDHDEAGFPVDVNQAIETLLELRSITCAPVNIHVKKLLRTDVPLASVNGYRFRQVLLNLITNADYAMMQSNSAGTLSISTESHSDFVRVMIVDDGPGVTAGQADGLLGPSMLSTVMLGGLGLSLGVCRNIVESWGGTLSVEWLPGKGSTYRIDLPADKGDSD